MSAAAGPEPGARERPDDRPVCWRRRLAWAALLPLGIVLLHSLAELPGAVELLYSGSTYPFLRGVLRQVALVVPVHLSEALLLLGAAGVLLRVGLAVRARARSRRSLTNLLQHGLSFTLAAAGGLYAIFLLSWGFNHARQPYAEHVGLEVTEVEVRELDSLLASMVAEANALRGALQEEDWALGAGAGDFDPRLAASFRRLARDVPALDGDLSPLRPAHLSPLLSLLGISGIYSPFTSEAHLNAELVDWIRPFVAAHEAAHGLGFAREDEANYIAWQVCRGADDPALRYSGTLAALRYVAHALDGVDPARAEALVAGLSEEVQDDLRRNREFWESKRSWLTDLGRAGNDTYLKLQGQEEGTQSYGRMVDLLVAEWRTRG